MKKYNCSNLGELIIKYQVKNYNNDIKEEEEVKIEENENIDNLVKENKP